MAQQLNNEVLANQDKEALEKELEQALQNPTHRQSLVRLYSVLLEVDMRNNPDLYRNEA